MAWIDIERFLQVRDRAVPIASLKQGEPEIILRIGIVRTNAERFFGMFDCFGEGSQREKAHLTEGPGGRFADARLLVVEQLAQRGQGVGGQGASAGAASLGNLVRSNSSQNGRGQPYTNYTATLIDNLSVIKKERGSLTTFLPPPVCVNIDTKIRKIPASRSRPARTPLDN